MDEKINIGVNAFLYPMPMVLVGTKVEGRANVLAVAWVSRVNGSPHPADVLGLARLPPQSDGKRVRKGFDCRTFSCYTVRQEVWYG